MDLTRLLARIKAGRTDLVFEFVAGGHETERTDAEGVSLIERCAFFGDVSAIKHLISCGASLTALGENLGLNAAAFHGHWRLCEFLLEQGADANSSLPDTGETPLHAALCTDDRVPYDRVLKVLLAAGADPNRATKPGVETGAFMRDCRTRGETPLHRAAAFGTEKTIQLLLDAGALLEAKDAHGDSPLAWASWYRRPTPVLRRLCYGGFSIHPDYGDGMRANLLGSPLPADPD